MESQVWEFENLNFFIFHSRNMRSVSNCRRKLTESCKTSHLNEKKGGGELIEEICQNGGFPSIEV